MASDETLFKRVTRNRDVLKAEGALSYPPDEGMTAIVCALPNRNNAPTRLLLEAETALFRREAIDIARVLRKSGGLPEVIFNPDHATIQTILTDEKVASIIAIGHGSLSHLQVGVNASWGWADFSAEMTHLKQGPFIQRHCGTLPYDLNVPLGTFIVDDPAKVFAPVGGRFEPTSIADPENDKIQQVFTTDEPITYQSIKADFPRGLPIEG